MTVGAAIVAVAVATVWRSPSSARAVDAPALANPVRIRQWISAMTLDQRRALTGRADTQVLLGDRVQVLALSGSWARVVVPGQPTPLDGRGYPGWVPVAQLAASASSQRGTTLTVITPTAWLRDAGGARLLEASFGTRLDALHRSGNDWQVQLPDGRPARIASSSVITGPVPASATTVVSTARNLLGLDYLWAGTSGFGFDCSGLTEVIYRVHGITIPRDADAQAVTGQAVSRSALRPGDLVFFARNGHVHHVGMYVGNTMMLEAPQTGAEVRETSLTAAPYANEYAGARRYLP